MFKIHISSFLNVKMFTDDLIETPLLENSWKTISFLNINPVHTFIMSFWFLRKQLIDTNDMQIQNVPCMTYCLKPFFHNVSYSILSNLFVQFIKSAFVSPLLSKQGRRNGGLWSLLRFFSYSFPYVISAPYMQNKLCQRAWKLRQHER